MAKRCAVTSMGRRFLSKKSSGSASRSRKLWTPRTPKESSTATSNPRIFSSPSADRRKFSISASQNWFPKELQIPTATSGGETADSTSIVGIISGTPSYMSPEQVRGDNLDPRTDIFSLGLVLYEMATGRQAFGGGTGGMIIEAVLTRSPVPARSINPDLPPRLEEIINKALHKDRDQRYQHAADIRADLQRLEARHRFQLSAPPNEHTASVANTHRESSSRRPRTRRRGIRTPQTGTLRTERVSKSLTPLRFCPSKTPAATRNTNISVTESPAALSIFWRPSQSCA